MADKPMTPDEAQARANARPPAEAHGPIETRVGDVRPADLKAAEAHARATPEERRVQELRDAAEAAKHPLDQTDPGGRYLLADGETAVDAHGQPVQAKKD